MKKIVVAIVMLASSCTLPDISVDIPEGAIKNETSISVEMEEFLKEAIQSQQQSACDFTELPRGDEGEILKCYSNCCLWSYYNGFCVERWCLQLENACGWQMVDQNCSEVM